jgi:uncharacterized protein involved in type VI secretion and phage assembly
MIKQVKHICPRQGDLFFEPVDLILSEWEREKKNKNGIIREGEATGHHHRLADPSMAEVFRPDWGVPIVVTGAQGATVVHDEHAPITLEPNTTYRVKVAREWDITSGTRYVAD